ncbi:MAG TPA: STAS domain-containing protein [Solirubrobacterales bacterium]|nr:STAS domain-containing protein [Solirubrobacterales bacterium]
MIPSRFEPETGGRFKASRPGSIRVTGRSRRLGEVTREAADAATRVSLSIADGTALLTAGGQLDLTCGDRFIACLREARDSEPQRLVVDLREVTFIDSTGLSLLLKSDGLARQNQFDLHIVRSPAEIVQAVLEATGVDKFLPLVDEPPA